MSHLIKNKIINIWESPPSKYQYFSGIVVIDTTFSKSIIQYFVDLVISILLTQLICQSSSCLKGVVHVNAVDEVFDVYQFVDN